MRKERARDARPSSPRDAHLSSPRDAAWAAAPLARWLDGDWEVCGRMSKLAEQFHCLVGKPGVFPWDPDRLDRWADKSGVTAAELYAARFVLNVWDGKRGWRCGRFDLLNALDHWDAEHRAAFTAWITDPWWPVAPRGRAAPAEESPRDTLPPESV